MARNFRELSDPIMADPERRAQVEVETRFIDAMLALTARAEQQGLTPERLAAILAISGSAVSEVERLENVPVEMLAAYVRAIGGELEVRAVFPDGAITLPYGAGEACKQTRAEPKAG